MKFFNLPITSYRLRVKIYTKYGIQDTDFTVYCFLLHLEQLEIRAIRLIFTPYCLPPTPYFTSIPRKASTLSSTGG
jgi:hypothetical protein